MYILGCVGGEGRRRAKGEGGWSGKTLNCRWKYHELSKDVGLIGEQGRVKRWI